MSNTQTITEQVIPSEFHIVLNEFYDSDVMDAILRDTNSFSKRDLNNLSRYKRSRKGGNEVEVIYHYGKNCDKDQIGRLYVRNSGGLQAFPFDMRNPLLEKFYFDCDMVNCHYILISKIGKDNNISTIAIDEYNNNRDIALSNLSSNRKYSKTAFLKAMYGGDIKLYNELYNDNEHIIDGNKDLLNNITKEINSITDLLYGSDKYENIRKIVKQNKKKNPKYSMLALILQTEERKCLLSMLEFMKSKNRNVDILIHDGCEIRKELNEREFPIELLRECEAYIYDKTGYSHKLEIKPLKHNFQIPENTNDCDVIFKRLSKEFEKTHAKIIDSSVYIKENDDKVILMSKDKFRSSYEHLECGVNKQGFPVSFIDKWMKNNNNIRKYDSMDMYPNNKDCPSNEYNLWRPFNYQLFEGDYEYNEEAKEIFFNHIKILCNNDDITYNYLLKWIAHMIKFPHKKSTTPTLISKQGSGKGTLLKLLTLILGEKKVLETSDPCRDVWGAYNGMMKDYYLINLNELSKKDTMDSDSKIKTLQTDPTITISAKNTNQFTIKSYHHFIITSNNDNPIKSTVDDRRNFIIKSSDEKKGNKDYFIKLNNLLDDNNVIRTMVDAFLEIDVPENFGNEGFPITNYQKELQNVDRPPHELWLEDLIIQNTSVETYELLPAQALSLYKDYCKVNGFGSDGMNVQKFGLKIHNIFNDNDREEYLTKKRTKKGNMLIFNINNLKIKFNIKDDEEIEEIDM